MCKSFAPLGLSSFSACSKDYFNIEDRWIKRLNETMRRRQDTKAEDLEKLYETLERARSPTGLLTVKIGEMESGRFIGKVKPDKDAVNFHKKPTRRSRFCPRNALKTQISHGFSTSSADFDGLTSQEVERLARKFKLDDPVASRFSELIYRRKKDGEIDRMHKARGALLDLSDVDFWPFSMRFGRCSPYFRKRLDRSSIFEDLNTIEQHLRHCKRANALATILVGKLLEGDVEELPDLTEAEAVMEKCPESPLYPNYI